MVVTAMAIDDMKTEEKSFGKIGQLPVPLSWCRGRRILAQHSFEEWKGFRIREGLRVV